MKHEVDLLQHERDQLEQKISQYQSSLPTDGIPVIPAARRSREVSQGLFRNYVAERTRKNWRFYPYAMILKNAFDSFHSTVTCDSRDEFLRTLNEWKAKALGLPQLRLASAQAVLEFGRTTSFLSGKQPR